MKQVITNLVIRQIAKLSQDRLNKAVSSAQSATCIRALILEHRKERNEEANRPRSDGR